MAFQHNLQESAPQLDSLEDISLSKPNSAPENSSDFFCECNICLDSARDPVVTLCGHLYCWPCIYKWLHVQTSSKCPICKSHISHSSLVPLYGRGSNPDSKMTHQVDLAIPSRPSAPGAAILNPNQQIHPNPFQLASEATTPTSISNPFVGMVGEIVCAMIFRSADSGFFAAYRYGTYENVYPVNGNGRRQVMQVEKSLNRLTLFFFCCFILCLLLF